MVNISVWAIIGAASTAALLYSKYKQLCKFSDMFAPLLMVLPCRFHQYIGATDMVAPIYWWNCASSTNWQRIIKIL
jgi:hypothetical protein